jgi:hypothetical protein
MAAMARQTAPRDDSPTIPVDESLTDLNARIAAEAAAATTAEARGLDTGDAGLADVTTNDVTLA